MIGGAAADKQRAAERQANNFFCRTSEREVMWEGSRGAEELADDGEANSRGKPNHFERGQRNSKLYGEDSRAAEA